MTTEILISIIGFFCTVMSSVVTFLLTKRKYDKEVDSQQIRNMSDAFDLQKKVNDVTIKSLQNRIDALQKENDELKAQVSQLQKQMLSLMSKINFETLKQTGNGNTVNKEMEEE